MVSVYLLNGWFPFTFSKVVFGYHLRGFEFSYPAISMLVNQGERAQFTLLFNSPIGEVEIDVCLSLAYKIEVNTKSKLKIDLRSSISFSALIPLWEIAGMTWVIIYVSNKALILLEMVAKR